MTSAASANSNKAPSRPSIGHIFSVVASSTAATSAFCTIIGYKNVEAYYSELGASWVLDVLPLRNLIHASIQQTATAVIFACLGVLLVRSKATTSRTLLLISMILLVICVVVVFLSADHERSISNQFVLSIIANSLAAASLGVLIGEVISDFATAKEHDLAFGLLQVFSTLTGIFLLASGQAYRFEAMLHKSDMQRLPLVVLADAVQTEWSLVTALDTNLLLMRTGPNVDPVFRLVAFSEVKHISKGSRPCGTQGLSACLRR